MRSFQVYLVSCLVRPNCGFCTNYVLVGGATCAAFRSTWLELDPAPRGRGSTGVRAAIDPTGSRPLVELGRTTTHDLFPIDDVLRESLAAKDVAVPDGTAGIVPWNLARNENESITSMHRLDADCRTG